MRSSVSTYIDKSRKRKAREPEEGTTSQSTKSAPTKFEISLDRSPPGSCPDCVKSPSRRSSSVAAWSVQHLPEAKSRSTFRCLESASRRQTQIFMPRSVSAFLDPQKRSARIIYQPSLQKLEKNVSFPLSHPTGDDSSVLFSLSIILKPKVAFLSSLPFTEWFGT